MLNNSNFIAYLFCRYRCGRSCEGFEIIDPAGMVRTQKQILVKKTYAIELKLTILKVITAFFITHKGTTNNMQIGFQIHHYQD